ncbi:MAG: phosphoribosyl-ATP diphosphatase [Pseudomonadota bacterium]|nr:phosphoribosyl-ATP diphosphatase [Pseudomonadota bacterium]
MNKKESQGISILNFLEDLIEKKRLVKDDESYTKMLLKEDIKKVIQKVGEESVEVLIEATLKNKKRTVYESADLIYHLLIMWNKLGISLSDIAEELQRRRK